MTARVLPLAPLDPAEDHPIDPEAFADSAHLFLQRLLTGLVYAAEEAGDHRAVLWTLGCKIALREELKRFRGAA